MPERIQLSRAKGWRMPPNTVKVTRGPGMGWGNPWTVADTMTVFECDEAKAQELAVSFFRNALEKALPSLPYTVDDVRRELAGQNLACFCRIGSPCHADVLLELANTPAAAGEGV